MSSTELHPAVLSIAGSDPSGGAGLQSDLRTFALHGLFGCAVVTALTVQGSNGVRRTQAVDALLVEEQLEAVLAEGAVAAIKTGMLANADVVAAVVRTLSRSGSGIPLVVDPVMVSSSGAELLDPQGVVAMREQLLPLATVVTPNLDEAGVLLGRGPIDAKGAEQAARDLAQLFGCCAVVKGGHAKGESAVDHVGLAAPGRPVRSTRLEAPWVDTTATHGTGCLFSAALCSALGRGDSLPGALQHARRCMDRGLERGRIGHHRGGSVWLDRVPEEAPQED
jgi:hydroxymethylpyrimidine/phosphomethylpyrimidine kinase